MYRYMCVVCDVLGYALYYIVYFYTFAQYLVQNTTNVLRVLYCCLHLKSAKYSRFTFSSYHLASLVLV